MEQLFNIDFKRINSSNDKEVADRKKNFELFLKGGLPNKKNENWKFSDLNYIISNNFKNIINNDEHKLDEKTIGNLTIGFGQSWLLLVQHVFNVQCMLMCMHLAPLIHAHYTLCSYT